MSLSQNLKINNLKLFHFQPTPVSPYSNNMSEFLYFGFTYIFSQELVTPKHGSWNHIPDTLRKRPKLWEKRCCNHHRTFLDCWIIFTVKLPVGRETSAPWYLPHPSVTEEGEYKHVSRGCITNSLKSVSTEVIRWSQRFLNYTEWYEKDTVFITG